MRYINLHFTYLTAAPMLHYNTSVKEMKLIFHKVV